MTSFYPFWIRYRELPSDFYYYTTMSQTQYTSAELAEANDQVPPLPSHFPPPIVAQCHSTPDGTSCPRTPKRNRHSAGSALQHTPLKSRAIHNVIGKNGLIYDGAVKEYVQTEFVDKIHRGLPVHEFIRTVWDFTPKDMPVLSGLQSYSLPVGAMNSYLQSPERLSYPYLQNILEHLRRQVVSGHFQEGNPFSDARRMCRVRSVFVNMQDTETRGNLSTLKPDLAWSTPRGWQHKHWGWHLGYIEVKKDEEEPLARSTDVLISKDAFDQPPRSSHGIKRKKQPAADQEAGVEPPAKRSRSNDHVSSPVDHIAKRVLTGDEVQSAKYMNEIMSHGVRSYATGFMVENTTVKLWYGDRMGIVQSEAFDFREEPHLLLLSVAAITFADHLRMGICPFVKFPTTAYDSYMGVKLELEDGLALNLSKEPLPKLKILIDNERKVATDFGAVGRGTTIVPVKTTGTSAKLFGREDLVAKLAWPSAEREAEDNFVRIIRCKLKEHAPQYLDHVVDMKCSLTGTMAEMGLPRARMEDLSPFDERVFRLMVMKRYEPLHLVNGVDEFKLVFVDVVRAHHWVWETAGVLHRDVSANNIMFYRGGNDNRAMGVLCDWDLAMMKPTEGEVAKEEEEEEDDDEDTAAPICSPTSRDQPDKSLPEKNGKSDVQKAAVPESGSKQEGTHNAASKKVGTAEQPSKRPRYRTGTGPFMALDLLSASRTPLHVYRHDLESFFFVLAWVCAVFDPVNHKFGHLTAWEQPQLEKIGDSKRNFFRNGDIFDQTFSRSHRDYQELCRVWVGPLYVIFCDIAIWSQQIDTLRNKRRFAVRLGNEQWRDSMNNEIAQLKARIKSLITYKTFMKCLGETV
ncbi:hypothetical protein AcV7_003931 [Taiwanofungus camphoratus]|nr:hypothetical protein AcV7_003931 [Antrodia cinnamomea]